MLNPDLLRELEVASDLPERAIVQAVCAPEQIADAVLEVLARAADGLDLEQSEERLLFWGIHVLGAVRDTRGWAPLVRLLRQPFDRLDQFLGDAQTITLPKILAGVFDGEASGLFSLLADRRLDSILRMVLFGPLAFLTAIGRIERGQAQRFLERFDDEHLAEPGDEAWGGWIMAIALLGLRDLVPRVEAAWREDRAPSDLYDAEWFHDALGRAEAMPQDLARFVDEDLGYIEDVLDELAWATLGSDAGEEAESAEFESTDGAGEWPSLSDPVRNPLRHLGRNDPCPCGSGRKFKNCCLGR